MKIQFFGYNAFLIESGDKLLAIDPGALFFYWFRFTPLFPKANDHNIGRSLKGFKLLTLSWSDGNSFLPLDFVLCSSTKEEKQLQGGIHCSSPVAMRWKTSVL